MPELNLKDLRSRFPELRLPEMSRDDIAKALGEARKEIKDVRKDLAHQRYIRRCLVEQQFGCLDVAENCAQGLRDFVRHGSSDLADERQSGCMRDLGVLAPGICARTRVPPVLHYEGDDDNRLQNQHCARHVLQTVDCRPRWVFVATLGRGCSSPNT